MPSSTRVKKHKSSMEQATASGAIVSLTHVGEHESTPSATSNLAVVGAVLSGTYAVALESTGTLPLVSMAASSSSALLDIMILQFDWRHVPKGSLLVAVNHVEWPDSPEHVDTLVRNLRLLARDVTLHFETSEETAVDTYGIVPAKVAPSPRPVETIAPATTAATARTQKRRAPLSDPTVGPHEHLVQRALVREYATAPETSTRELADLRTALAASLLDWSAISPVPSALANSPLDSTARSVRRHFSRVAPINDPEWAWLDQCLSAQSVFRRACGQVESAQPRSTPIGQPPSLIPALREGDGESFEAFCASFTTFEAPFAPVDAPAPLTIGELTSSRTLRRALSRLYVGELCAGKGTFSSEARRVGAKPRVLVEIDEPDCAYLGDAFSKAEVFGDFFERKWQKARTRALAAAVGGISCVFVSDAGLQRGSEDPRAPIAESALPEMTMFFRAPFAMFENVPGIATVGEGSVLRRLDANYGAANMVRVPRIAALPMGLELAQPSLQGAPGIRQRAIGYYELDGLEPLIGPCPTLDVASTGPLVIQDVLDHGVRDPALVVRGRFCPVRVDLSNTRWPVTAGWLFFGGPGCPIVVGSRVTSKQLGMVTWVVWAAGATSAKLFLDDRRSPVWRDLTYLRHDPLINVGAWFKVLDIRGTAFASTDFGVPPIGCAKQLWRIGGDCCLPSAAELWRLQEAEDGEIDKYAASVTRAGFGDGLDLRLRRLPGKGVNRRLANAGMRRLVQRAALLSAVLASTLPRYDDAIELGLQDHLAAFQPAAGLSLVFVVLVAWVSHAPRVLVGSDLASLPCASTPADAKRKAAQSVADGLLNLGAPSRRKHSFLVKDFKWARLMVAPCVDYHPIQLDFPAVRWASPRCLDDTPLRAPVALALAVVAGAVDRKRSATLPPPLLPGGARPPEFVPQQPAALTANARLWRKQLAREHSATRRLRSAFTEVADSDADDAEYFAGWADQVASFEQSEVPPDLRGSQADYSDPLYASMPFSYRDAIPVTVPAPVPPVQKTTYKPTTLSPGIISHGAMERWLEWWPLVIADMQRYRDSGGTAKRTFNEPFIITQSDLHREARGLIWDLRRHVDGHYVPVDYGARLVQRSADDRAGHDGPLLHTHLNVAFLAHEWRNYPDQQMVAMITRTGVDFMIDASAEQLVIFPHLVSLPRAFSRVEKELRRLHSLSFNEFVACFPFVPWTALPQGSVPRKYEPGRDRRTTECGAPRNPKQDRDGNFLIPLNTLIGTKDVVDDPCWRLPNAPTTTGFVTYAGAVEASAAAPRHKPTKWPPEVKVRVEDLLHDEVVLKHAGLVYDEPLYAFTADAADFFNQLRLAAWVLHRVGLLWLPLDDSHAFYTCVAEFVLGFGFSCASNIAQRFAYGLVSIFWNAFDEVEQSFFDADEADPARAAWIAARRALSKVTGRNELRLATVLMYTDDPIFVVVGAARAVRLLRVWRWVTRMSNLTMAIAAKHMAGTKVTWLGLTHMPGLAITCVPAGKHMRTLKALADLYNAVVTFVVRDYEELLGMLEHLLPWAGGSRSAMLGLYGPLKRAMHRGPSTPIKLTDVASISLKAWIERLRQRAGVHATSVISRDVFLRDAPSGAEFIVTTDAAKDGTSRPGIGGYCHGLTFRVPLATADVKGDYEIPIPVLEFIGIVVAVISFAPLIADSAGVVTFGSDSLTSVDGVLNDQTHAELMTMVHAELLAAPEYALIRGRMRLGHVFGEGNIWADAESRGFDNVIAELSAQLGVKPVAAQVPKHALRILDKVRLAVRQRPSSPSERGTDAATSSCSMGDGPSAGSGALLPQGRVARRAEPERPRRITELVNVDVYADDLVVVTTGAEAPAATAAPWRRVYDAVLGELLSRPRPPTPAELSLDAGNRGNSLGDGPARAGTAPDPYAHLRAPSSIPRVRVAAAALAAPATAPPVPSAPAPAPLRQAPGAFAHLRTGSTMPAARPASARPAPAASTPAVPPLAAVVPAPTARPAASDRFAHLRQPSTIPPLHSDGASAHRAGPSPAARSPPLTYSRAPALDVVSRRGSESAKRTKLCVQQSRASSLAAALRNDSSPFALRPTNAADFESIVADMAELIDEASPIGTLEKDATAWRRWEDMCVNRFGTTAWRPSSEGLTADEMRRERFLFSVFTVLEYRVNIKPRKGPAPQPQSAINNATAVKRVLKRGGISAVATPELTVILKGLLRQYLRLHGPETLVPTRAEPLTNDDTLRIFNLPNGTLVNGVRQGTWINGKPLDWAQPFWCSFKAFLATARQAAFRKADVLPVTADDFGLESASRFNLAWVIGGVHLAAPSVAQLNSLALGDRAVLTPPPVKNDPFSTTFGGHPIWLPFDPLDPLNAARWLRDLELTLPVDADARRRTPLFGAQSASTPLTHGPADRAFAAVAEAALGVTRAAMLSLHSPRVFCACALLAQGASRPLIMALCRWKSEASLDIYARLQPEDYVWWVNRMASASVTNVHATNLPFLRADNLLARAVHDIA